LEGLRVGGPAQVCQLAEQVVHGHVAPGEGARLAGRPQLTPEVFAEGGGRCGGGGGAGLGGGGSGPVPAPPPPGGGRGGPAEGPPPGVGRAWPSAGRGAPARACCRGRVSRTGAPLPTTPPGTGWCQASAGRPTTP